MQTSRRFWKYAGLLASGASLLQITACLGSDPQFLVTTLALNAVISNVINFLFGSLLGTAA